MIELIRRDALKDDLKGFAVVIDKPQFYLVDDADYIIDTQPSVDAVEVVRCRNCIHGRELKKNDPVESMYVEECVWCMAGRGYAMLPEQFCDAGERKEGVNNETD